MYLQESAKAYEGECVREPKTPLERTTETSNPKDEEQCIIKNWDRIGKCLGKANTHLPTKNWIGSLNRRVKEAQNENVSSDLKR